MIYLVRHAQAAASSPEGDRGRALTAQGRADFEMLVADLREELRLRRVICSPYARARETAAILAAPFGIAPELEPVLASGISEGRELLELAVRSGPGTALVGHNPEIADAIAAAATDRNPVAPGTIAAIDVAPGRPRVRWVRAP